MAATSRRSVTRRLMTMRRAIATGEMTSSANSMK